MFAIIDVRPGVVGLPTTAYEAVDQVETSGGGSSNGGDGNNKAIQRVFRHISCSIEAEEAEEVTLMLMKILL